MDESNENVNLDTQNEETESTVEEQEETHEEVDEEKQRLIEENKKLFARAKKAEGFELVDGEWVKKSKQRQEVEPKKNDLSTTDLYALMNAKVPESDIDQVRDYAQLKGISVSEALKTTFVKSLLSESEEIRRSAEVTTTGNRRAPTGKMSDEAFLKKIAVDGPPEPGTPEAERLFEIRHQKR